MPRASLDGKLIAAMSVLRTILPLVVLGAAVAGGGCGGADRDVGERAPAAARPTALAPPDASRPTAPAGATLVKLERLDGRFGRHDTLIVARDGRASLVLAHGGGGFRKAACMLDRRSVKGLQHDLRRLPIDGRARPVAGYEDVPEHSDGVIVARPPVYTVTYRRRFEIFGGETMPVDGAPLAARLERILTAHEGRCHVTFHRP
jgi:hypothetical protein